MQSKKPNSVALLSLGKGLGVTSLAVAMLSPNSFAQSDAALEEIVITGTKRETNVQDAPISVTAFSADDIKEKNITNVSDLQYLSPALSIQDQGQLKFINIRGVGIATVSPQTTSGVAYHIDGFFIPNEIAFSETYFDLGGIEVYRGPQGTFLGQNSTGGALFVNTANPGFDETAFSVSANLGTYGYQKAEGAVDIPFSDSLAMRVAGIYEKKDGFHDNIGTNDDLDSFDRLGLRATLLYQPSDSVEISLKHEMTRSDSGGPFQKDLTDGIPDQYTVAYNYPTQLDLDVDRTILKASFDLTDTLTLNSVTGYQNVSQVRYEDADNTSLTVFHRYLDIDESTIQQEFNFVSDLGGAFEYVAGAFYFNDESYFYSIDEVAGQTNRNGDPAPFGVTDGKPAHKSWSVYGEGTFKLTSNLELVAGLRYIDDTVLDDDGGFTCRTCTTVEALTTEGRAISVSANTTETTWRAVLNYHTNNENTIYGLVSKGFKSGGFNPGRQGFDPEYVTNFEAGYKATLMDGTVRWNSSIYYMDYDGFQLRLYDANAGPRTSLLNTTDQTIIYGFESELMFATEDWSGSLGFGYGKSSLKDVQEPDPRNPPPPDGTGPILDLDGTSLPFHPKFSLNAALANYQYFGDGTLTTQVRLSHTDDQWTEIYQVEATDYLDAYTLAHIDLKYESGDGWWVKGYVTNLFDEDYISGKRVNRARRNVQFYGAPREAGVEVGFSTF